MIARFPQQTDITILYVEDEKALRERFAEFFALRFTKYLLAENGLRGLEYFNQYQPDLIVTDIRMPVMDGLEMIVKIREINKEIPIIITSAFNEQDYLHKAIDLNIATYVLKPIKRDKLEQALLENINIIQLRRKEAYHKAYINALINAQPNILILTDGFGIKQCNQAFFDFFAYDSLEAFFQHHTCICEFFLEKEPMNISKTDKTWLQHALDKENNRVVMYDQKRQEERIFHIYVTPLVFEANYYVVCFNDISLEYNYQKILEQKVLEETNKRIEQEKIMLYQSKQAVMGEMLSAIAHQLKQPINVIHMTAAILKYNIFNPNSISKDSTELLNELDKQVYYMTETISTFKNFLKPQDMISFDIITAIKQSFNLTSSILYHYNINTTIVTDIDDKTRNIQEIDVIQTYYPLLKGNLSEFKQVLMNLITNTKDAIMLLNRNTDKKVVGEINIQLCQNQDTVILTYVDNAGGIDGKIMQNIFKPYQTTKGEEGTGLGLYMVKQIIDKMQGEIQVTNIKQGALFKITLLKYK